jgi:hypothetical protein
VPSVLKPKDCTPLSKPRIPVCDDLFATVHFPSLSFFELSILFTSPRITPE